MLRPSTARLARLAYLARPVCIAPLATLALLCLVGLAGCAAGGSNSSYKGWSSYCLKNDLVNVQVVPEVGGRVMQVSLGGFEYFWVNPDLAGKPPTPTGLDKDGGWLNYGGSKLWPAPQGWGRDDLWPGPPDAVLDGQPHAARWAGPAGLELTSRPCPRSGIQFIRTVSVDPSAARVTTACRMRNTDTKPRRWGIWQNSQLNAASRAGAGYSRDLHVYIPVNPRSVHPGGFSVLFGAKDNPQFQADRKAGLMHVHFDYKVGKIAMDSSAGWYAFVDAGEGYAFVETFAFEAGKPYPDNASVEVWTQGLGSIIAWGKEVPMKDDRASNPYLVETEVLGPFAALPPGQEAAFTAQWSLCRVGKGWKAVDCTPAGLICQRLQARREEPAGPAALPGAIRLSGQFGVFARGRLEIDFLDAHGRPAGKPVTLARAVTPLEPVDLSVLVKAPIQGPPQAAAVCLTLVDEAGQVLGDLGSADL